MELKLDGYIRRNHPDVLRRYLDEIGGVAVAVLDREGSVVVCNEQFAELTGLQRPRGAHLSDVADVSDGLSKILPPDGAAWSTTLLLKRDEGETEAYHVHALEDGGRYFLFCDEPSLDDNDAVGNISQMNQQLTNLNRELERKNKALENAKRTIEEMARTDPLTGLANRRQFQDYSETILAASRRHGFAVSLALGDLDHFKDVNDTFGHEAGDEVLKLFAGILQDSSRKEDLPARWGGEEFLVLMPHTTADEARELAERVRGKMENSSCAGVDRPVTVSLGVTQWESDMTDVQDLVARADEALYRAKGNGRNSVVAAHASNG